MKSEWDMSRTRRGLDILVQWCMYLFDGHNERVPQEALVLDLPLHIRLVVLDLQPAS